MASEAESMSPEQMAAIQKQNCIFCKIIKGEIPSKKVHEDKECVAILDINPANDGHVLLLPKEHYSIMPQVPENVLAHMADIAKKISKAQLISVLGKSTSVFVANGAAAGQKAPHFMIHIIPRKTDKEFFTIPSNPVNPSELETVKTALIKKLEHIMGKKVVDTNRKNQVPIDKPTISEEPIRQPVQSHFIPETKEEPAKDDEVADPRKIAKVGIKKEKGYLYYIDEDGDIARAPMSRGNKRKKKDETDEKPPSKEDDSAESRGVSLDDISNMLLGGRR